MVKVKFYATFRELVGRKELEINGVNTVGELLEKLFELYPEMRRELFTERALKAGKPVDGMVLVNGVNILHINSLETKLGEEDVVHIFPPAGGG